MFAVQPRLFTTFKCPQFTARCLGGGQIKDEQERETESETGSGRGSVAVGQRRRIRGRDGELGHRNRLS